MRYPNSSDVIADARLRHAEQDNGQPHSLDEKGGIGSSYLLVPMDITAEQIAAATRTVAANARDAADCRELLAVLGLEAA